MLDYRTVKTTVEIEAVDIPTMHDMPREDYRHFLDCDGVMLVDHHGVLRSSHGGYPIATNREQLEILIGYLKTLAEKVSEK